MTIPIMFVDADPRVAHTLRSWLDRYFPARRTSAKTEMRFPGAAQHVVVRPGSLQTLSSPRSRIGGAPLRFASLRAAPHPGNVSA
jgi:hypothetical protein